jgi:hypothetical protein
MDLRLFLRWIPASGPLRGTADREVFCGVTDPPHRKPLRVVVVHRNVRIEMVIPPSYLNEPIFTGNHFRNSAAILTLMGLLPPPPGHIPIVITKYYLATTDPGLSYCAPSPSGGLAAQEGGII